MLDYYLKFSSEDQMYAELTKVGFLRIEGDFSHPYIVSSVIGYIYDGETKLEGYHINLRVLNDELDLSSLEKFIVNPSTPYRVWA